jgi:hypothetical protein
MTNNLFREPITVDIELLKVLVNTKKDTFHEKSKYLLRNLSDKAYDQLYDYLFQTDLVNESKYHDTKRHIKHMIDSIKEMIMYETIDSMSENAFEKLKDIYKKGIINVFLTEIEYNNL